MTFLHPEILYALAAIIIPVIIHLFNFRRYKKLYFSDITRLKSIAVETRKQHKLKNIIILILRILAISFIVIAFAEPVLKSNLSQGAANQKTLTIFTDNSFSMLAEGENGRLFEESRKHAISIVTAAPENTKFIILSGKNQNSTLTRQEALSELENLEIDEHTHTFSQIIEKRNRLMKAKNIDASHTYILSDFQKNVFDFNHLSLDSVNQYTFVPLQQLSKRNIFIDSCNIHVPELIKNGLVQISVRIVNPTQENYSNIPVKVYVNNKQKAVSTIDIQSNSFEDVEFSFNSDKQGWNYGMIEIEDFPITYDDNLYFTFKTLPKINVLIIDNNTKNRIQKYYESDKVFNPITNSYPSVNYTTLNQYNLVVFRASENISSGITTHLQNYIENGGNVLFIPNLNKTQKITDNFLRAMGAGSVNKTDTATTRVIRIASTDNIFQKSINKIPENADLPIIHKHLSYSFPVASGVESLITLLNGDELLSRKRIGNGSLYILSTDINNESGNLSVHPLFVPIMHRIAEKVNDAENPYIIIGKNGFINIKTNNNISSDKPVKLIHTSSKQEIIPYQKKNGGILRIDLNNISLQTGYYNVINADTIISTIAINHNRAESYLNNLTHKEIIQEAQKVPLKNIILVGNSDKEFKNVINSLQNQSVFWKLFIIFALFALLLEILVIKYWK